MSRRTQLTSVSRATSRWVISSRAASTSSEAWTRPIAAGVNSAYDAALELLDSHAQRLTKRAEELRSQSGKTDAETADLQRRVKQLEVEARLLDPKLRAKFASMQGIGEDVEEGEADALRTLAERQWKRQGRLDRLVCCNVGVGGQPLINLFADATSHPNERDTGSDSPIYTDNRFGSQLWRVASCNGRRTGRIPITVAGMSHLSRLDLFRLTRIFI